MTTNLHLLREHEIGQMWKEKKKKKHGEVLLNLHSLHMHNIKYIWSLYYFKDISSLVGVLVYMQIEV